MVISVSDGVMSVCVLVCEMQRPCHVTGCSACNSSQTEAVPSCSAEDTNNMVQQRHLSTVFPN